MSDKTIEIYYDIKSIPGIDSEDMVSEALEFRNQAIDLIERALVKARIGVWTGAEIGMGEVNFGFEVSDFDLADAIVRQTVKRTPYENIREILWLEDNQPVSRSLSGKGSQEPDPLSVSESEEAIDRGQLTEGLSQMGFEASELLATLALNCQRLLPISELPPEEREGDNRTHLGGTPDVPADFEWPRFQNRPLAFLAQVDYEDENRLMLFFYDTHECPSGLSPEDRGAFRVYYVDRRQAGPADAPRDLPPECQFPEVPLALVWDVNLPDVQSTVLEEMGIPESDLQLLRDMELEQEDSEGPAHHMFGYPGLRDGDMEPICQLVTHGIDLTEDESLYDSRIPALQEGEDQWILLFQCDSDPRTRWDFGFRGRLFFWIRSDELEQQDFDGVWAVRQEQV